MADSPDPNDPKARAIIAYDREPPYTNPRPGVLANYIDNPVTGEYVYRGYIKELQTAGDQVKSADGTVDDSKTNPDIPEDKLYRLNFHFNPMSLSESWQYNPNVISPINMTPDEMSVGFGTNSITWSFDLVFDRTGDTSASFGLKPSTTPITTWKATDGGVLEDMRILQKLVTAGRGGPGATINSLYVSPVQIVFGTRGGKGPGQNNYDPTTWKFPLSATGFINSLSIRYTRFNALMTPVQAFVSLSLRLWEYMPEDAKPKFTNLTRGKDNPWALGGGKDENNDDNSDNDNKDGS